MREHNHFLCVPAQQLTMISLTLRKLRSAIWNFYTILPSNECCAKCNKCGTDVKRGKSRKDYSTSPLQTHLRTHHPEEFASYKNLEQDLSIPSPTPAHPKVTQSTLEESFASTQK
jgi:hypothetical protein